MAKKTPKPLADTPQSGEAVLRRMAKRLDVITVLLLQDAGFSVERIDRILGARKGTASKLVPVRQRKRRTPGSSEDRESRRG